MLLCAWFVDLKLREAVSETWSLTYRYSINVYILTRYAASRASNFRRAWDFAKINTLNLVSLTKESGFQKNGLSSLIWPDFDSFESANWPLKSSTNFPTDGKFVFAYDLHKLLTQRHLSNAVFDANLNWRVPSGLFGTRVCCHASQRNNLVIKIN